MGGGGWLLHKAQQGCRVKGSTHHCLPMLLLRLLLHPCLLRLPPPPQHTQDIEPGRCVMAQRCVRVNTVEDMFRGMRGGPFTVEMKFDGNRMQVGVGVLIGCVLEEGD